MNHGGRAIERDYVATLSVHKTDYLAFFSHLGRYNYIVIRLTIIPSFSCSSRLCQRNCRLQHSLLQSVLSRRTVWLVILPISLTPVTLNSCFLFKKLFEALIPFQNIIVYKFACKKVCVILSSCYIFYLICCNFTSIVLCIGVSLSKTRAVVCYALVLPYTMQRSK